MVVGEFTQETDLLVIGGGPGGYSCAFAAAELGISTMIVDTRDALGGVCLHEGCVPSKTMLHAADVIRLADDARNLGVAFEAPAIDVAALGAWIEKTVATLAKGLDGRAKKLGVRRIVGRATFEDARHVTIPGSEAPRVKFRRAVIATGAVDRPHPALPYDGGVVLRPGEAARPTVAPPALLVVGSDYLAVEAAAAYAALGSRVTLVCPEARLLPDVDAALVRLLERRLRTTLEGIATGVDVASAETGGDGVEVTFTGEKAPPKTRFDRAVVAVGREAALDGLGLEALGVTTDDRGGIVVDEQGRTSNPRLFAVGDVTGRPMLADRAIHQGRVAAEVIAGQPSGFDAQAIPRVIFTDPQIAWCGLTQPVAEREGIPHVVRAVPWGASGRAAGMGRTDGVTRIICDPETKIVLGVGIAGAGAAELIGEGCLAVEMGAELDDLARTIHPHPTTSELLGEAASGAG